MAIQKTEAIILERRDFRETSFLVNFFTRDFGRLTAQAKGARRKIDKFGTNFLPLTFNKIIFYENNNNNLHIISQADLLEDFDRIGSSIEKFTYASYFLELINATMPTNEKNIEVFELLISFLHFLNKMDKIKHITQIFEIKFLNLSGFKPRLDCCVSCGQRINKVSRFSYVLGGLLCSSCFRLDQNASFVFQGTIASLEHIEKVELQKIINFKMVSSVSRQLEEILRNFIDFHFEQRFKSLDFLKKVKYAYV